MKKTAILLTMLSLLMCACDTDDKGAIEMAEKYRETESTAAPAQKSFYPATDWLTPETEYICPR